jgi:hypothetical protein
VTGARERGADQFPSIVDPWFNFRATKYLVQHGFYKFWDWFDDSKEISLGKSMGTFD